MSATNPTHDRDDWAIPSVDEGGPAASPTWELLNAGHSRRVVLKGALLALGAFAVDAVVGLPFVRARRADAAAYQYYSGCQNFWHSTTICVPSYAYYGSDNRGGPVSGRPGAYWHRSGYDSFSGRVYTHDPSSCNGRNAWIWVKNYRSRDYNWMCSDGHLTATWHGWSSFSICRSAWR